MTMPLPRALTTIVPPHCYSQPGPRLKHRRAGGSTPVSGSGKLLVVHTADHMVRTYSTDKSKPTPTYIGSFGNEGQLDGTSEYPNGVATDKRAHVYVTDRENNRVQVWGY
jgi:hypothetical protein